MHGSEDSCEQPSIHSLLRSIFNNLFFCLFLESPSLVKTLENKTLPEGSNLSMSCAANGHPTPEYTWYRDAVHIARGDVFKQGPAFHIPHVSREDAGWYICITENWAGQALTKMYLNVECKCELTMYYSVRAP